MKGSKYLINLVASITGEATKSTVGLLIDIPIVPEMIGNLTKTIISDIATRQLSKREEFRVGKSATYALSLIASRIDKGDKIREDGYFFDFNENYHSPAEEIFEGVLLKCKNEHEEKKIKYISNIFVNIAFHEEIRLKEANLLLRLAQNMTYTQLSILSLYNSNFDNNLRNRHKNEYTVEEKTILSEILGLKNHGLLNHTYSLGSDPDGRIYEKDGVNLTADYVHWDALLPDSYKINTFGEIVYKMMNLNEIADDELQHLLDVIKR